MAGKVDDRVHPSRLSTGLLFSDFSVFSNAFFFFFQVITLLSYKQCVGREQEEHCGLWYGKTRRREQFSLKHL
ncbi:hypothetical protein BDV27DRAFT_138355 [Aspergillus caelatus]|uniref:Uncharacterized protein n=1 Tax=Aspergillus caelatus TaxID=61420 RepID=A0A5N6ZK52_9EURO|nr:uncharacterized protein BDV27DRAFT_138355 [Aspergillus caelatus]KAE8358012.1 hypothetical protein BDV27DRAFT_138355 [Aspergillus caelatus]